MIRALQTLSPEDWTLAPLAIELLAWDQVVPASRDGLERMGSGITGMLVDDFGAVHHCAGLEAYLR